jgi:hypothetical protein
MFISIGTEANSSLKGAYPGISRLNPYQYELTDWLKNNIPEDENTYHMGSISTSKTRWLWMISNRHLRPSSDEDINSAYNITHVIIDYSDFALIGDQNTLNKIQEWEKQNMANNSLIYDKTYIKVYKVEN